MTEGPMELEYTEFVRKPFKIEAVRVTEDNFDVVAEFIGRDVQTNDKGERFILVNKNLIPNGYKVFVGWWVTQMGDNVRCYPHRAFKEQFESNSDIWETIMNPDEVPEPKINNIFDESDPGYRRVSSESDTPPIQLTTD